MGPSDIGQQRAKVKLEPVQQQVLNLEPTSWIGKQQVQWSSLEEDHNNDLLDRQVETLKDLPWGLWYFGWRKGSKVRTGLQEFTIDYLTKALWE